MDRQPIAYLASEYPAISHTFIFREVQSLRAQGFTVKTASIRRPENLHIMTPAEQAESEATAYIKTTSFLRAACIHVGLLLGAPRRYWGMLRTALRLTRHTPLGWMGALAYFAEAGILLEWMRREKVAHVHVHFANPAGTVALIASGGGVTYSLSVHGPDVFYNVDANLLGEKLRHAIFARSISYFCRSQLQRIADFAQWPNFPIVRCGIDLEAFKPRPEPDNATPEILCVGRLTPAKGQHVLLQACQELHARGVSFHLTFVGDGPDRASLESLAQRLGIAEWVRFTGAVGQGEIHRYYDRADVFALPSFAEGLPVVLMEAMAKEIACVSTRIAGTPELIEDGVNGVLTPASDCMALANHLERLLTDREFRLRLGRKAREKVEAEYDLGRNCHLMGQVFDKYVMIGQS